ncbi:hypothetical protein TRFO_38237 [Tritrichomonas foetus]|uniref:Uncharacterized protein n=1 Tax=Tritrichomonas foetus TaxID=1144522 RepID=A0A1J4JAD5_9EUKA|nr:hypothetical protein TRFO_38237 [Tritrichomonas foetus]|eukprot:OHS95641.1 hypothetical protein TRFO_38237 [Tritrichomonas foetus]
MRHKKDFSCWKPAIKIYHDHCSNKRLSEAGWNNYKSIIRCTCLRNVNLVISPIKIIDINKCSRSCFAKLWINCDIGSFCFDFWKAFSFLGFWFEAFELRIWTLFHPSIDFMIPSSFHFS